MGNVACCSEDLTNIGEPLTVSQKANMQKSSVEHLQRAVDCLFKKYDKDGNGYLDKREVIMIINTALASMGSNRKAKRD